MFVLVDVQLMPDFSMFIHMAMILAMIWILNRTFFRPINRILDARERNKGGQYSESEGILNEAAEKEERYKNGLLEAREEGYEFIERERSAALELKQNQTAEVKEEVGLMLETELGELERQTQVAKNEIATEAEKMADKISSNILRAT
jgi:F-type H+-transporting ATPase subunit b